MRFIQIGGYNLPVRDRFADWDAYVFQEGLVDDTYRLRHLPTDWPIASVLDLGVNIGTFFLALSRLPAFNPAGYVGFEASPENFEHAKLVGAAAGLPPGWINRVHNTMIAGDYAPVAFKTTDVNPGAWGAEFGTDVVGSGALPHTSIHQAMLVEFPNGIDLLKTDIEGGEYDVLMALRPAHLRRMVGQQLDPEDRPAAFAFEARQEAERILEHKSLELYLANTALLEAHAALEKQVEALQIERDRVLTMSRTDYLTQLPNRSAMLDMLDQRMAAKRAPDQQVWLFLVNLQHFQFINAALGPRGGDSVLRGIR
jgi:FkbM family methyltransferase